jgi:hypothetical protein
MTDLERLRAIRKDRDYVLARIQDLQKELAQRDAKIAELEANLDCKHEWTATIYTPIHHPERTLANEAIQCHIPASTTHRWTRTCSECGKVEVTLNFTTKETLVPSWDA